MKPNSRASSFSWPIMRPFLGTKSGPETTLESQHLLEFQGGEIRTQGQTRPEPHFVFSRSHGDVLPQHHEKKERAREPYASCNASNILQTGSPLCLALPKCLSRAFGCKHIRFRTKGRQLCFVDLGCGLLPPLSRLDIAQFWAEVCQVCLSFVERAVRLPTDMVASIGAKTSHRGVDCRSALMPPYHHESALTAFSHLYKLTTHPPLPPTLTLHNYLSLPLAVDAVVCFVRLVFMCHVEIGGYPLNSYIVAGHAHLLFCYVSSLFSHSTDSRVAPQSAPAFSSQRLGGAQSL